MLVNVLVHVHVNVHVYEEILVRVYDVYEDDDAGPRRVGGQPTD